MPRASFGSAQQFALLAQSQGSLQDQTRQYLEKPMTQPIAVLIIIGIIYLIFHRTDLPPEA